MTYTPTWRTRTGLMLIALAMASFDGHTLGALPMMGMWLIWESLRTNGQELPTTGETK